MRRRNTSAAVCIAVRGQKDCGDPDPVVSHLTHMRHTERTMTTAREIMTGDATCVGENQTIRDAPG